MGWLTDAQETHQILGGIKRCGLSDHYALDYRWEQAMRPACKQMMVIDDLADRFHDCDLLLDQNYGSSARAISKLGSNKLHAILRPSLCFAKPTYADYRAKLRAQETA